MVIHGISHGFSRPLSGSTRNGLRTGCLTLDVILSIIRFGDLKRLLNNVSLSIDLGTSGRKMSTSLPPCLSTSPN